MTDEADSYVTVPVAIRIDRVEKIVGHGQLRALIAVTLTIGDGVEIEINGIGVMLTADGWQARSPQHKCSDGVWRRSVGLPRAIWNGVVDVFIEQADEERDPRNYPTPHAGLA